MTVVDAVARPAVPAQVVGRGTAAASVDLLAAGRPLLIVDDAVASRIPAVVMGRAHEVIVVAEPTSLEAVAAIADRCRSSRVDGVVAVGGGNVIDLAKLVAGCLPAPDLVAHLSSRAPSTGFVPVPAALWRPLPLVCAPSTFGTGAEVSAVACWETGSAGSRAKAIGALPATPTRAAVYDPEILRAPEPLVRGAAAEAWSRIVGSFATPTTLPAADEDAIALIGQASALVRAVLRRSASEDDDLPVRGALVSAATHGGWALRGRGGAPFPLWFVANELSMVRGAPKIAALSALWPAWTARVRSGDDRWGSPARLDRAAETAGFSPGEMTTTMRDLVAPQPALLASSGDPTLVRTVARRVIRRFGRLRPLPRGLDVAAVEALIADAGCLAPGTSTC